MKQITKEQLEKMKKGMLIAYRPKNEEKQYDFVTGNTIIDKDEPFKMGLIVHYKNNQLTLTDIIKKEEELIITKNCVTINVDYYNIYWH